MLGTVLPVFIMLVVLILSVGAFALWSEFNSSAKKYEYTRLPHHKIDESKLLEIWDPRSTETLEHLCYAVTAVQY